MVDESGSDCRRFLLAVATAGAATGAAAGAAAGAAVLGADVPMGTDAAGAESADADAIAAKLPATLDKDDKLKALIRYFARDAAKAEALLAIWPPKNGAETSRVLVEITQVVGGQEPLRKLLSLSGY